MHQAPHWSYKETEKSGRKYSIWKWKDCCLRLLYILSLRACCSIVYVRPYKLWFIIACKGTRKEWVNWRLVMCPDAPWLWKVTIIRVNLLLMGIVWNMWSSFSVESLRDVCINFVTKLLQSWYVLVHKWLQFQYTLLFCYINLHIFTIVPILK